MASSNILVKLSMEYLSGFKLVARRVTPTLFLVLCIYWTTAFVTLNFLKMKPPAQRTRNPLEPTESHSVSLTRTTRTQIVRCLKLSTCLKMEDSVSVTVTTTSIDHDAATVSNLNGVSQSEIWDNGDASDHDAIVTAGVTNATSSGGSLPEKVRLETLQAVGKLRRSTGSIRGGSFISLLTAAVTVTLQYSGGITQLLMPEAIGKPAGRRGGVMLGGNFKLNSEATDSLANAIRFANRHPGASVRVGIPCVMRLTEPLPFIRPGANITIFGACHRDRPSTSATHSVSDTLSFAPAGLQGPDGSNGGFLAARRRSMDGPRQPRVETQPHPEDERHYYIDGDDEENRSREPQSGDQAPMLRAQLPNLKSAAPVQVALLQGTGRHPIFAAHPSAWSNPSSTDSQPQPSSSNSKGVWGSGSEPRQVHVPAEVDTNIGLVSGDGPNIRLTYSGQPSSCEVSVEGVDIHAGNAAVFYNLPCRVRVTDSLLFTATGQATFWMGLNRSPFSADLSSCTMKEPVGIYAGSESTRSGENRNLAAAI